MATPKPPKTKIGILFETHIDNTAAKTVRAGYAELRARLTAYVAALAKDENILVSDSYVCVNTSELLKAQVNSANTTTERLAAVVPVEKPAAKPEAKPKAAKATPASKTLDPGKTDPTADDPPHIVVHNMAEIRAEVAEKQQPTGVVVGGPNEDWLPKAFAQLERKSEKTTTLLTILARHGKPMSPGDLAEASKTDKQGVSNWLSVTAKKYKFVKSAGRGLYEFDRAALVG